MRAIVRYVVLVIVAVGTAACGALFNSSPQSVMFTSSPDGAEVWVDGTPRGVTPLALDLTKSQNHSIVFKLGGHRDVGTEITRHVSATYVILDILGGVLPVVVDAATGSWYKLSTNTVHGSLVAADAEPDGRLTMEQLTLMQLGLSLDEALKGAR